MCNPCIEPADFNVEVVDLLMCMKNFEVLVCNLMVGRYAPRLYKMSLCENLRRSKSLSKL